MLPIFRMISVGGVLLAIVILALALSPPGGSYRQFAANHAPARGALIDRGEHPEWRLLLLLAALRRAGELERLRDLPDAPVRQPEVSAKDTIAALPADRTDTDPEDETGSLNASSGPTIPIEIGATSSSELPVIPVEERPPSATLPERVEAPDAVKPVDKSPQKIVQRQRAKAPASAHAQGQVQARAEAPVPFNLLQALFDSLLNNPQRPAAGRSVSQ
jgi:hypothetical protein